LRAGRVAPAPSSALYTELPRNMKTPAAWRNRATEEQKRVGWEMAVRIEKIVCTVLHEAHERQVEETMATLSERPDGFYG
jgi:hypothetical protein